MNYKTVLVTGASAGFGLATAKLLANPDYHLTLLSKSAGNSYEDSYRITAVNIDATNIKDLKKALEDQDVVFCAVSGVDQPAIARNLVETRGNL